MSQTGAAGVLVALLAIGLPSNSSCPTCAPALFTKCVFCVYANDSYSLYFPCSTSPGFQSHVFKKNAQFSTWLDTLIRNWKRSSLEPCIYIATLAGSQRSWQDTSNLLTYSSLSADIGIDLFTESSIIDSPLQIFIKEGKTVPITGFKQYILLVR